MAKATKSDVPLQNLLTLKSNDLTNTYRAAETIESAGGQVMHIFGPRVIIGDVGAGVASSLELAPKGKRGTANALASAPPSASMCEELGLAAWNHRHTGEFQDCKAARPRDGELWNMGGHVVAPDGPGMHHTGEDDVLGSPEAATEDMSPYLIGSVAVGLILVEGPTANLQFSAAERTKVVAEVQEGLTWLGLREPRASVTWSYDIRVIRVTVPPNPNLSGYEPLEAHWRNPAMAQMGFSANFQGVRNYVASIRTSLGTRWGYVAFFTKYPVHHFAYASKPRLVMHYDNDGWTPDNIDRVFTHETGHIFGCPDEYSGSGCTCTARYGYLQELNGNCERCASPFVECIMAANTWNMCRFTPVHFGWRDSDGDGILDPIDTAINPSVNWARLTRRFPALTDLLEDPAFAGVSRNDGYHETVPTFLLRRVLSDAQMRDVEEALCREEDEYLARLVGRFDSLSKQVQAAKKAPQAPKRKMSKKTRRGR